MAHMYPQGGPTKETTSDAERRLYDLLARTLDDDYHVFHSAPWADKQDDGRVENGEVDFIIAHPDRGILLFEVKGGGVSYDGAKKRWTSRNHERIVKEIKDPFLQASTSAHRLKAHFKRVEETRPYAGQYWLGYAAWFPDIEWKPGAVPLPHVRDELVLDSRALAAPAAAVERLLRETRPERQRPMTGAAFAALVDVLAPRRTIKPLLRDAIRADEVEFINLTEAQYRRLDMMLRHPRVAVRGAAGTGKTVLALEAARAYARQEFEVLVLCVNPSLAAWVAATVAAEPEAVRSRVAVQHVDALCLQLTEQARRTLGATGDAARRVDGVMARVARARGHLDAMSIEERRHLLDDLGAEVTIYDADHPGGDWALTLHLAGQPGRAAATRAEAKAAVAEWPAAYGLDDDDGHEILIGPDGLGLTVGIAEDGGLTIPGDDAELITRASAAAAAQQARTCERAAAVAARLARAPVATVPRTS